MADNFEILSDKILDQYLDFNPSTARYIGLHQYDGKVANLSKSGLEARVKWAQQSLEELRQLDRSRLSEQQKFDYSLLEHTLGAIPFNIEEIRDWEQNPLFYSNELNLVNYLARNYAPLPDRLEALMEQQQQIPGNLEIARQNLKPPFARPLMEVALQVFKGYRTYCAEDVVQATQNSEVSPALREAVTNSNNAAMAAIEQFVGYLQQYLEQSHSDFAIGRDKYQKLLWHGDMVDLSVEEVLAAGERDLERNYADFEETARKIDPNATPDEVRERLKHEHPSAEELIPYTTNMLEEIRTFLVEHDLITIPSEIRPIVANTPPQMRWSFASMSTPGPYEKAPEAYYYVTLPESHWTPKQQAEWLTAYSYTTMEDISIHEVYPGHYVHFLNVKNAPSRVTKTLRGSTAHSEGWAHYCEQMMVEEGYGTGRLDVKLAQLDAALKRDCRYIAAMRMHTQGMSVDEATQLFMRYAHMAEHPARQEALRGTWQPGYLAYTLGKLMFLKLREDLKQQQPDFNLKVFHDACVGNGVPPVPLLRRKLLGDNSGSVL